MEKAVPTEGIVGFFDILGYKSFLANNSVEQAAQEVLDTLSNIDKRVGDLMFPSKEKSHEKLLAKFKWLVFSDTILLTTTFEDAKDARAKAHHWISFVLVCLMLNRHLFDYGLPLRGCLSNGHFLLVNNCFAGEPIIKCYEMVKDLELAATVLTDDAKKHLEGLTREAGLDPQFASIGMLDYLVPRKSEKKEKLRTLNPCGVWAPFIPEIKKTDIRQYVLDSFWSFKKDLPPEVIQKVTNTELFLRHTTVSPSVNSRVSASVSSIKSP